MMQSPEHNTHRKHDFHVSRTLACIAVGGVAVGAAIILAPHLLPAIGIGSADMAEASMFALHGSADAGGSGLAGIVNGALESVPLIGEKLAAGGLFNAGATALTGIGGILLGNYIAKNEDGRKRIKWGNVIKMAALATSALIAMPTVLSALSTGIIFLSTLSGSVTAVESVIGAVDSTLGIAGGMEEVMMGFSGVAAAIPHFLTCGVSLLPAALSLSLWNQNKEPEKELSHASRVQKSDGAVAHVLRSREKTSHCAQGL